MYCIGFCLCCCVCLVILPLIIFLTIVNILTINDAIDHYHEYKYSCCHEATVYLLMIAALWPFVYLLLGCVLGCIFPFKITDTKEKVKRNSMIHAVPYFLNGAVNVVALVFLVMDRDEGCPNDDWYLKAFYILLWISTGIFIL